MPSQSDLSLIVLVVTPTIDQVSNDSYVGVTNKNFMAINRQTGVVKGSFFSHSPIRTSAVITTDRRLFFTTQRGTMYGFDLNSISFSNLVFPWRIVQADTITSSPAIDADGDFYVGTSNGKVKKLRMKSDSVGVVVWEIPLGGEIVASPIIDGRGVLYVGSTDGNFYCVDIRQGVKIWGYNSSDPIVTSAIITNSGHVYFGNQAGKIYGLDTSGNLVRYFEADGVMCSALLYSNGAIYWGTSGGSLYSLFLDDTVGLPRQAVSTVAWPTFQGNNQRTGEQAQGLMSVEASSPSMPISFHLSQNFPNLFNP